MMLQDFYTVHGDNAIFIAKTFYKTLAVVKYLGGKENGLPGTSLLVVLTEKTQNKRKLDFEKATPI